MDSQGETQELRSWMGWYGYSNAVDDAILSAIII